MKSVRAKGYRVACGRSSRVHTPDRLRTHPHEFLLVALNIRRDCRQFVVVDARERRALIIRDDVEHTATVVFLLRSDVRILTPDEFVAEASATRH